jgi:hypothetical protein
MLAYESTVLNHTPADAKRMATLATARVQIPSDRLRVRSWVDHAEIWITIHFGEQCTLLPALRDLLRYLREPTKFLGYRAATYRALIWTVHRAMRSYFSTADAAPLEFITYLLKVNAPISMDGIPKEVTGTQGGDYSSGAGTRASYTEDTTKRGAPPGAHHDQEYKRNSKSPDCVKLFAADLDRARAACSPERLRGAQLAKDSAAARTLFGPAFCSLLQGRFTTPCLNYFIRGSCSFRGCANGHMLTSRPSQSVFNGIRSRVKTVCDNIVKDPKA